MSKPSLIYLIRHTEYRGSEENSYFKKKILSARSIDEYDAINRGPWLSDEGIKNALLLRSKSLPVDQVFCSYFNRAAHTAAIAFPTTPTRKLRELNERNYALATAVDIKSLHQNPLYCKPGEGESFEDLLERVSVALDYIFNFHNNKRVAIVSHRDVTLALLYLLQNKSPEDFPALWDSREKIGFGYCAKLRLCESGDYTLAEPTP